MDCIFCRIVAGEIPAFKVFEDEATLAFMDINPASEGHLLVIPKHHFENIFQAEDAHLARVMATARRLALAMREVLGIDSLNLLQANGKWALQTVPHFHLHLIPRREGDQVGLEWPLQPGQMEAIKKIAAALQAAQA